MRLLNVRRLELESFVSSDVVKYAILSHTWSKEEITYEDMKSGDRTIVQQKAGYSKLQKACQLAMRQNFQYIWIDTCCIDKSSSAELSEAINSMFLYYEKSQVCYAYLEDVVRHPGWPEKSEKSKWFTRGWTLQELIAPSDVEFYDSKWELLGSKKSLSGLLAEITHIDEDVLRPVFLGHNILPQKSIAKRMSWASRRETTREEDIAYCLLGIFNVAMPLLYGEGKTKAFTRLQMEIMKESTDMSIFAWTRWKELSINTYGRKRSNAVTMDRHEFNRWAYSRKRNTEQSYMASREHGVLAMQPKDYIGAANVVPLPLVQEPYTITNNGLQIRLPIVTRNGGTWAILGCHEERNYRGPLAIRLDDRRIHVDGKNSSYRRMVQQPPETIPEHIAEKAEARTIHILINPNDSTYRDSTPQHVWIRRVPPEWDLVEAIPSEILDEEEITIEISKTTNKRLGYLIFKIVDDLSAFCMGLTIHCLDGTAQSCSIHMCHLGSSHYALYGRYSSSRYSHESEIAFNQNLSLDVDQQNVKAYQRTDANSVVFSSTASLGNDKTATAYLKEETIMGKPVLVIDVIVTQKLPQSSRENIKAPGLQGPFDPSSGSNGADTALNHHATSMAI
jgi:Heterokaryon incompatibility protein (HET)